MRNPQGRAAGGSPVVLCPKHAAVDELVDALTDCQVAVCEEYCGPHIHVNACENAKALLERIATK